MYKMTSHERFKRMYEHREADRVPIIDAVWNATIERWQREGMPVGVDFTDYFGLDKLCKIDVDNSPQYDACVIEETEEYVIYTTAWGATMKDWKHAASTPEFIDYKIIGPDEWVEARKRIFPSKDRIPWDFLEANYRRWKEEGYWIRARLWFGFNVTHSYAVGTERLLIALIEDPEWCVDMFNHQLDVSLALQDMGWDAGYEFEEVSWDDDLGYKFSQFFSVSMYRELLKPVQKRVVEWAHKKGIKTHLHSCGDINPFIPEIIDLGIDAINPMEVKAGMDPIEIKKKYGKELLLRGGINAMIWDNDEAVEAEIRKIVPVMKESGGYIFASDHSIPSSVSVENYKKIVTLAKEVGKY